eukprot:7389604-Prymnesium_polylepis.3
MLRGAPAKRGCICCCSLRGVPRDTVFDASKPQNRDGSPGGGRAGGAPPGRRPQVRRALSRSPPGTAASPEPGHAASARGTRLKPLSLDTLDTTIPSIPLVAMN